MIQKIKYNRLQREIIDYYQSLRIQQFENGTYDIYYDIHNKPIIVVYHKHSAMRINTKIINYNIDVEMFIKNIQIILKITNYSIQINDGK